MLHKDLEIFKHIHRAVPAKKEGMRVRIRGKKEKNIKSNKIGALS